MSHHNTARTHGFVSKGKENAVDRPLEPCAATASLFLYAEGPTIICLHHDSLTVERTFSNHVQDVQFICVDNVSERGAGRLVVSWDVGMNPIIWDLFTGEQISRLASQEPLTAAAWMRNGNLAFGTYCAAPPPHRDANDWPGDKKGEVTIFEPASNEVFRTATIFHPITALAPSADCQTYAIGYQNGSILLAALQPHFTLLHTLTSRRTPSPIAALTWHASSSKQKSDMLATYTVDGDLRVWSVAKPPTDTTPRVIRTLRHAEPRSSSRTWIHWSRNGRILQYCDSDVWVWDVKTKMVTYEVVPTIEYMRGIAAFGPTGTFFTLGPDHTIQQYDVEGAQMVQNVRRTPLMIPQTPPQEIAQPAYPSESDTEITTPASQSRSSQQAADSNSLGHRRAITPRSHHTRDESAQSSQAGQGFPSASKTNQTIISSSTGPQAILPRETFSPVSTKSGRKNSRLRQEVIMSPEDRPVPDLFPHTRARLSDVPYRQPKSMDESHMTPDDLRRQMLSVVFGWDDDVDTLINEELGRIPVESAHAVYLTRWLNQDSDVVAEAMTASTASPTLNWMRVALSSIGDSPGSKKMAQVLIEQMLIRGDIHAAVAALIACGDWNDAVEVYVSRNHHMEAVLLACLLMPTEWQRLSFLVRNWGEHVVQKSDQHLAVRCFSCTGVEPSDPWTSPGAQLATGMASQQAPLLQPSIYHKTMERRSLNEVSTTVNLPLSPVQMRDAPPLSGRAGPAATGLKLITSFGGKDHYKFPGLMSDEGTPINAALVTPIAESAAPRSAISPGGFGSYRSHNMRSLNSAMASRPGTPGGLHKSRLPSIGETPIDNQVPHIPARFVPGAPPTPADSGSDKERDKFNGANGDPVRAREELPMLLTPARYEPPATGTGQTPQTAVASRKILTYDDPPAEDQIPLALKRNSSRSRKPDGLSLKIFSTQEAQSSQERHITAGYDDPIERPSTTDTLNSMDKSNLASPPDTGNSYSSHRSAKSPSVGARSLDQYISSLEQAQYYKSRPRGSSVNSKQSRDDLGERRKTKTRDVTSEDLRMRGEARGPAGAKRSPSSPVPMSPGELGLYNASFESLESAYLSSLSANQAQPAQQAYLQPEVQSSASAGERRKHRSRSRQPSDGKSRSGSQAPGRRRSPDGKSGQRGRSKSRREGSTVRSPSSPETQQPSEDDLGSVSSVDPALRIVSQNRHRLHSQSGRRQERSMSTQRQVSPERRSSRMRSRSRQPETAEAGVRRKSSISTRSGEKGRRRAESTADINREYRDQSVHHQLPESARPDFERSTQTQSAYVPTGRRTKELAQAELEARRLSLQRRPSAPAVPFPGQGATHHKSTSMDQHPPLLRAQTDIYPVTLATMSAHPSFQEPNPFARSRPTTPRAMKHPGHVQNVSVPELPNMGEMLSNEVYRPPKLPGYGVASPTRGKDDLFSNPDIPYDMPKHPAFDSNIGTSRPSSRSVLPGRHASPARAVSRDRTKQSQSDVQVMTIGEDNELGEQLGNGRPPIVPELQHLAMPPPPPPPPSAPRGELAATSSLRIQTSDLNVLPYNIPLPLSAYPNEREPTSAVSPPTGADARHRRGRSGSEHQLVGKIRNFAGRMRSSSRGRSTSRPRENNTKSPQLGSGDDAYSPYESLPSSTSYPPQSTHRELATVIEGR